MAKYRVTAPDGSRYVVNAPEGASQADVLKYAQSQFQSTKPASEPVQQPTTSRGTAYMNAAAEGSTFGLANKLGAGARMADERDLPLSQQMMQSGGRSDLADLQAKPGSPGTDESTWDARADGSTKGHGWLGLLRRPDGDVSSELSVGVEIDGKETEIPLLVPTLTRAEIDQVLSNDKPPRAALDKAVAFARERISAGKDPFASRADSPQPLNGFDLFKEQLARGQQSIDTSRKEYPDVFNTVEPIAGATMASIAAPLGVGGTLLSRIAPSVLASGIGGGAGAGINESSKPGSTRGSTALASLMGGAQMAAAELGGLGIAGAASKLIAPGIRIPVITPARDKVASFLRGVPGKAKEAANQVVDAFPQGATRNAVAKGVNALGSAANTLGRAARTPLMTNAAMPLAAAVAGPMVSVPVAILKELMQPGFMTRYLARDPLSQEARELLRQAAALPTRGQAAP